MFSKSKTIIFLYIYKNLCVSAEKMGVNQAFYGQEYGGRASAAGYHGVWGKSP